MFLLLAFSFPFQEAIRLCLSHRGARPGHRPRPMGIGEGHTKPALHRGHRQGDHAPPSRRDAALPQRGPILEATTSPRARACT